MAFTGKHLTITIIILAVAAATVGGAIWAGRYMALQVRTFVNGKLTQAVHDEFGDFYHLSIKEFHVDYTPPKRISVTAEFSILPDSASMDSLRAAGELPRTIYALESGRIQAVLSFNKENLKREEFRINSLSITNPNLRIWSDSAIPRLVRIDSTAKTGSRPLLRNLSCEKVTVTGGEFSYQQKRTYDTVTHIMHGIAVEVSMLEIDSAFSFRRDFIPRATAMRIAMASSEHSPAGEGLTLNSEAVALDIVNGRMSIDSLRLSPLYGKLEFPLRTRSASDWIDLTICHIGASGVDFKRLITQQGIKADSLIIRQAAMATCKNRQARIPARVKPLLYNALQRVKIPVSIACVKLEDCSARYDELPVGGQTPGTISLDRIYVTADTVTNIPSQGRKFFTIKAKGRIMEQGALTAIFLIPIDPANDNFRITGSLGGMPMDAFNPMVEPLGKLSLHEGTINSINFSISGDSIAGSIDIRLLYSGLKLDVLNKEGLRSWLGSTLANSIVLPANPLPGKDVRIADTWAARNPYRSYFNYLWRIIFEGTKESVGLTPRKQAHISALQKKFKDMKDRRNARRASRQARQQAGQK